MALPPKPTFQSHPEETELHTDVDYMSKVANWHGHKCIEVKDVDSYMAMQHSRKKSQAPTHLSKLK